MMGRRSTGNEAERQLRSILAGLPENGDAALGAIERVDDWNALLSAAQKHGVDGVLLTAAAHIGFAPQHPAWEGARRRLRRQAVWADVLSDTLHAALKALGAHRIPVAVLKGPVLAARLYDPGALRPSTDLDLLVDPSSLDQAVQALEPLGYVLEGGEVGRFFRDHHHHVHMLHATLPTLELHFDAYRGFGTALPAGPLLARSRPCSAPGWSDAQILEPEDEFVYLAVHAASHRFERLGWLYELKLLVLRHGHLRWDRVAERAETHHVSAVVSFACQLLSDWLSTPDSTSHLRPLGLARRFAAERLIGTKSSHGVNAVADVLFCALLCQDIERVAAFSTRFARIKVLHEGPRRLRSRIPS